MQHSRLIVSLATLLLALSGCSSHCDCPKCPAGSTTVITPNNNPPAVVAPGY